MSSTLASASGPECSLIVPLYRNEANLPALLVRLADLHRRIDGGLEVVLVVDGSPDDCYPQLLEALPSQPFPSSLHLLTRNFGSFAAIRHGLAQVTTPWMAVMAADLQEPASLFERSFAQLRADAGDVVLASRIGRADGWRSRLASGLFWGTYRRLVQPDLPPGGIDVFACNAPFRDALLRFNESNSSLIGQLLWLGFRRIDVPYLRQAREVGQSAWTFRRKLRYLADSVFAFSDLPIRLLLATGLIGLLASALFGVVVLTARLVGWIEVPGYTALVLTVLFFAALNLFGLGIIGAYVWRAYENTKQRPLTIAMRSHTFQGQPSND